ncbi:MAG: amidohydrolase family protein, partial [Armatimonadota bacterium]
MPSAGRADLLLVNGRILTMARKPARALALSGDRILAIGGEDVLSLRGPRTRLIDLEGRLALPGFTDSHLHLAGLARRLSELDLTRAQTLAEAQRAVRARAHRTPPGKWITGRGLDKNRWGGAFPNRQHLDEVAPDNPVALTTRDGHSLWVNSLALKRCGIGPRTRAPAGGRILRDSRGYPSGILLEAATRLVDQSLAFARAHAVPSSSDLVRALRSLLRLGITSVHLMEETPLLHPLQDLRESGDLCLRVTLYRSR